MQTKLNFDFAQREEASARRSSLASVFSRCTPISYRLTAFGQHGLEEEGPAQGIPTA